MKGVEAFLAIGLYIAPFVVGFPLVHGFFGALQMFTREEARSGWLLLGAMLAWILVSAATAAVFFVIGMAHCCRNAVMTTLVTIMLGYLFLAWIWIKSQARLIRRHPPPA